MSLIVFGPTRTPATGQRSAAWRQARVGRLTGSRAAALLAKARGGRESISRESLRQRLITERLTGQPQEPSFLSAPMLRGITLEPHARAAYALAHDLHVDVPEFVPHPTLWAGCSPDGVIFSDNGVVEIKCPNSLTHVEYLQTGTLPAAYRAQVLHTLWITGADWCDFVSYDDRFGPTLRLVTVRVPRDDKQVHAYELLARMFLREVDEAVQRLAA